MNNEQTKIIVAYIALAVSIFSIIGLFFIDIPDKNRDLINIALGAMLGWSSSVVNFYFGNSDQSHKKEGESR